MQGIGDTATVENGSVLCAQNIILVEETDPSFLLQMKEGRRVGRDICTKLQTVLSIVNFKETMSRK